MDVTGMGYEEALGLAPLTHRESVLFDLYMGGVLAGVDRSMSNDIPGILAGAARAAAQPPVPPPQPAPERVAPEGVSKAFGFDHRMGTGGTHGLG